LWHCHVRRDESRLYGNRDADRGGSIMMFGRPSKPASKYRDRTGLCIIHET